MIRIIKRFIGVTVLYESNDIGIEEAVLIAEGMRMSVDLIVQSSTDNGKTWNDQRLVT